MKTIALTDLQSDPGLYSQTTEILEDGGLICFPAPSGYKIAVDLASPTAITHMIQAKRRVKNAPSLVFVPEAKWIDEVAGQVTESARKLIDAFWPGPLTLLVLANEELHPKVRKPLTKAKGWLGVRMPHDEVSKEIVTRFGRPLLVSSANIARKHGANSVAQVRKNFGRTVALMVDAGDLAVGPLSTLVDVSGESIKVVREEAVSAEDVERILSNPAENE